MSELELVVQLLCSWSSITISKFPSTNSIYNNPFSKSLSVAAVPKGFGFVVTQAFELVSIQGGLFYIALKSA